MADATPLVELTGPDEWTVTMRPEDHPGLVVTFEYVVVFEDQGAIRRGTVRRTGFAVRLNPEAARVDQLCLRGLRRSLPLGVWERVAVLKVFEMADIPVTTQVLDDPGDGSRSARIAKEYIDNLRKGIRDPAAEIARRHGVKPATARSWIHRAREDGYLGAADPRKAGVSSGRLG